MTQGRINTGEGREETRQIMGSCFMLSFFTFKGCWPMTKKEIIKKKQPMKYRGRKVGDEFFLFSLMHAGEGRKKNRKTSQQSTTHPKAKRESVPIEIHTQRTQIKHCRYEDEKKKHR